MRKKIEKSIKTLLNKEKLFYKYRFFIHNEDTFQDVYSVRLSRINFILFFGILSLLLMIITSSIIIFTPIKEYIPGYTPLEDKKRIQELVLKLDSVTTSLNDYDNYINDFKRVIKGDIISSEKTIKKEDIPKEKVNLNLAIEYSKDEIEFKNIVEEQESYNVFAKEKKEEKLNFFPPVKGVISSRYDENNNHKAVDILCRKNTLVKSILKGIVIISEWSIENGYIIVILHDNNIISIYKHNSKLLKKQYDLVEQGEAIGFSGDEGEYSTGPHLHFELFIDNIPVNPEEYIEF